jgi:hypothetical protein
MSAFTSAASTRFCTVVDRSALPRDHERQPGRGIDARTNRGQQHFGRVVVRNLIGANCREELVRRAGSTPNRLRCRGQQPGGDRSPDLTFLPDAP